ncbi:hypothetical protein OH76DRAFT_1066594 [Lentinus brumalis]|uniref:Uncharacterized protein n=1 Tax=Lentinus brumalis TaxID=2498619 RepID=A0A371DNM4_9APHY|nr:hypothetical protein OH76DRAFT_1066594 [Polyporus brumalis]
MSTRGLSLYVDSRRARAEGKCGVWLGRADGPEWVWINGWTHRRGVKNCHERDRSVRRKPWQTVALETHDQALGHLEWQQRSRDCPWPIASDGLDDSEIVLERHACGFLCSQPLRRQCTRPPCMLWKSSRGGPQAAKGLWCELGRRAGSREPEKCGV